MLLTIPGVGREEGVMIAVYNEIIRKMKEGKGVWGVWEGCEKGGEGSIDLLEINKRRDFPDQSKKRTGNEAAADCVKN